MFRVSPKTSEVWLFKGNRGGLAALAVHRLLISRPQIEQLAELIEQVKQGPTL